MRKHVAKVVFNSYLGFKKTVKFYTEQAAEAYAEHLREFNPKTNPQVYPL